MTTPRQIVQLERLFDPQTVDLACHAALPVALTPDLLHAIRVNFFLDIEQPVSFWAESRLLLSPLCHAIGDGLYQINPPVRDELLKRLMMRHGEPRLRALAELLWQFGEHGAPWADRPELDSAQRLAAISILDPEAARSWLDDTGGRRQDEGLAEGWFVAMRGEVEVLPPAGPSADPEERLAIARMAYAAAPNAAGASEAFIKALIDGASALLEQNRLDEAHEAALQAATLAKQRSAFADAVERQNKYLEAGRPRPAAGEVAQKLLAEAIGILARVKARVGQTEGAASLAEEARNVSDVGTSVPSDLGTDDPGHAVDLAQPVGADIVPTPSEALSVEGGLGASIRRVSRKERDSILLGLAREYDETRGRMDFSDERTRLLEDVRRRIQKAGAPSRTLQSRLRSSRSAGERLVLVCALEKQPDFEMLDWLVERFADEQPFIQYWAARALLEAASSEEAERSSVLLAAIASAKAVAWDEPAKQLLEQAREAALTATGDRTVDGAVSHAAASEKDQGRTTTPDQIGLAAKSAAGRAPEDIKTSKRAAVVAGDGWRQQILWVDDRPENNVRERKALEAKGIESTLALSTQQALEMLSKRRFGAIISDMGRREGPREGYVLLDAVRATDLRTPFFIYAGSNAPAHKEEAEARGAQGSTNSPSELFEMVSQALSNDGEREKLSATSARSSRQMFLRRLKVFDDQQRLAEPIVTAWKLWPAGSPILVKFLDGGPALHSRVFSVAQEWAIHAKLRFLLVTGTESHIRISFLGGGSWSALGTEALDRERYPTDKPTMNYGWLNDGLPDDDVRHVVLHEFGTALGLVNEHQSPNCPLAWNASEIIRDLTGPPNNFTREATIDLFRRYQFNGPPDYRPFDPTSVMMWPLASSWTKNGQSFSPTSSLSASDKRFIAQLYLPGTSA